MSTPLTCRHVRSWVVQILKQIPPKDIFLHTSQCAVCRGGLLTAAAIGTFPIPTTDISCESYALDVAALIECEQNHGAQFAWETFTNTYWHMIACFDCAEIYALTRKSLGFE